MILIQYFRRQILEISSLLSLRIYGGALCGIHVLTFFFWRQSHIAKFFADKVEMCWSFYQNCHSSRVLFAANLNWILWIYLATSIFSALAFFNKKWLQGAYWGLALLTLLKFSILIQDYRMMGNYHYMALLASLFFLLIPRKVFFGKCLLVGFYLSAGSIRFNTDWMSGAALFKRPWLEGPWLAWSLAYVVVLEMVLSLLLFSRRAWIFWLVMTQFLFFHLYSYFIVGFFFPAVMFLLLSIFIVERWDPEIKLQPFSNSKAGFFFLALFAAAQIYPALRYPDSAITGKGRLLALNMFDGRALCENKILLFYKGQTLERSLSANRLGARISCDPYVYYSRLKYLCNELRDEKDFVDLSFDLVAKRATDKVWRPVFHSDGFCQHTPKVSWLGDIRRDK